MSLASPTPAAITAATVPAAATAGVARRLAGQGMLLLSGYAAAQGLSFLRNAIMGHALSRGDFGIAAAVTLVLQLVETLTDLGADRLIVQARDGDAPSLLAAAHTTLVARGIATAVILYFAAGPVTQYFAIPHTAWAFEAAALVPLVRGFLHLDCRRAQRRLDNKPQLLVEVIPQIAALAATVVLVSIGAGYATALWIWLVQAVVAVAASHVLAEAPYRLGANHTELSRLFAFGWPIWLSAIPLAVVYQGDRIVIGRVLGMEELAAFSAAFMITMVPGLVAAKVGHALMLPALSACRDDARRFQSRFARLTEATALAAALYGLTFMAAGGAILPVAFGDAYAGYGAVVTCLAVMWALRMLQAAPGMALMALGETRPFLVAGLLRATALAGSLAAATSGAGLLGIAAAGIAGEALSLAYVAWRLELGRPTLGRPVVLAALSLAGACAGGLAAVSLLPADVGLFHGLAAAAGLAAVAIVVALGLVPALRHAAADCLGAIRQGAARDVLAP